MYCSSCGGVVAQDLSYCNHCGAKLGGLRREGSKPSELFPDSLVWAIVSVFVCGLGGTIGLMAVMKDAGNFNPGMIIGLTLLSFLAMIAVECVLIWLLVRSKWGTKEADGKSQLKESAARELGVAPQHLLTEPALSITEHTTRTLEPATRQRRDE
jgi:hypothetical protein